MYVLAPKDETADELEIRKQTERGDFVTVDDDDPPEGTDKVDAEKAAKDALEADKKDKNGDDDKGSKTVPHAKFHEVNEERKTEHARALRLEGENALLKKQLADREEPAKKEVEKEVRPDPDLLREQAHDAILEGDKELANKLVKQAAKIDRELATEDAVKVMREEQVERDRAQAQRDMNKASAALYVDYPFLNYQSDDANKSAIEEVRDLRDYFIERKGMEPVAALQRAAKQVGDPLLPKKEKNEGDATDPQKERDAAAVHKAAKAANAQPAVPGGKGDRSRTANGEFTVDVSKMTEKQFREMPEAEKARARGDVVA